MMLRPGRSLLGCFSVALLLAAVAPPVSSAGTATITYRRVFKGSLPEFIQIRIPENGTCSYDIRQLSEDPDPEPFEVGKPLREKIFQLAAALHNFQDADLDVHRRIANLGQKTFRYEQGAESHEVTFNYTLNPAARQLQMIFEGLARQQQDMVTLERRMKYDRLGVNDALLEFETDLDRKILPEPERLLPTLDQIAADPRIVDIARERARALAERIRNAQIR